MKDMRNSIAVREGKNTELMLRYAAEAGFREVMIGFGESGMFLRSDYEREVEKIAEWLARFGLSCGQTHLPCYHLTVSSEITNEETELSIRRAIRASAALGAGWTAFHPRTSVTGGYSRTVSFSDNLAILESYLEVAEECGVGIAVENMPLYPRTNAFWRFFGGGWEELCELCDRLCSDKIGICWDFGHAHTAELDQAAALRDIGSRLKMTHVHDNTRSGDHHQLPGLSDPQWGSIDWQKAIGALREIGYSGSLALEVIDPPLSMYGNFMRLAYDSLEYIKGL